MRLHRAFRLSLVTTLFASACSNPFVSYCGEETRSVGVNARFAEPTDPNAGYVQVDFLERHTAPEQLISWLFFSQALKGHITRAVIVDRSSGAEVYVLPIQSGLADLALQGSGVVYAGTRPFNEVFTLAADNRLSLRLTTDVAGRESLTQPLQRWNYYDWRRARCD